MMMVVGVHHNVVDVLVAAAAAGAGAGGSCREQCRLRWLRLLPTTRSSIVSANQSPDWSGRSSLPLHSNSIDERFGSSVSAAECASGHFRVTGRSIRISRRNLVSFHWLDARYRFPVTPGRRSQNETVWSTGDSPTMTP